MTEAEQLAHAIDKEMRRLHKYLAVVNEAKAALCGLLQEAAQMAESAGQVGGDVVAMSVEPKEP